jgi:hypothetical protein
VQGGKADAARALAYIVNANMTLSGGCPSPPEGTYFYNSVRACMPPPQAFACTDCSVCARMQCRSRVSDLAVDNPVRVQLVAGLVSALQLAGSEKAALTLAGNSSAADIADVIVGGIAMAAQPCGPPNALSGSSGRAPGFHAAHMG